MNTDKNNIFDNFFNYLKNHKVIAPLLISATIITVIITFYNNIKSVQPITINDPKIKLCKDQSKIVRKQIIRLDSILESKQKIYSFEELNILRQEIFVLPTILKDEYDCNFNEKIIFYPQKLKIKLLNTSFFHISNWNDGINSNTSNTSNEQLKSKAIILTKILLDFCNEFDTCTESERETINITLNQFNQ